jgi:phenylacetate-CoA ligase
MLRSFVNSLPYPIKQGAKYIYGTIPPRFRYSKVFWDTYNFLQESQWWSREKLKEYQMQQLEKLLNHAYNNVPYYRRVFDERGLKPKDIQDFDDLKKLPYLTKEIIRNNLEDLIARNYPSSKLQYCTTGGSTGIPMGFYVEKDIASAKEWAFMLTQWDRVGFRIGDRCVVLRGDVVRSANKEKFWEYNPVSKNLILSSYHMTDETLPGYIAKIRKFRPDFIQAYPSAVSILAKFIRKNNIIPFSGLKALLCGSENLYPWQRTLLEETFQCRIYSWYGHTEQVVLGGECEKNTYYHVFPEYGIAEIIGKDDKTVTQENELGEIVATGFNNFVCPFIRYRTQDFAILSNKRCECGRNYSLLKKIEGRLQDFIISNDKSLITLTALIFAQHFKAFGKIKNMQLYQDRIGEVEVRIIPTNDFLKKDSNEIIKKMESAVSGKIKVEVKIVDKIQRTQSGKYRFLIQKLPIKFGVNRYQKKRL